MNALSRNQSLPLAVRITAEITSYDRRMSRGRHYNIWALPQYLGAWHRAEQAIADGATVRAALTSHFCGRLLDRLLKAAGEPLSTRDEQRGSFSL